MSEVQRYKAIGYKDWVADSSGSLVQYEQHVEIVQALQDRIAILEDRIVSRNWEIAELDAHVEALEQKYADCPHPKSEAYWCGCSYDHPNHVCAVHAPQLRECQKQLAALEQQVAALGWQKLTPETQWEHGNELGRFEGKTFVAFCWYGVEDVADCLARQFTHYRRLNPPQQEAQNA